MRRPYRVVLCDLDGTLADTVPLIIASHRHAVREVLGRDLHDDVLRSGIGTPLLTQMRAFDDARAEELVRVYRTFNHAAHDEYVRGFDDAIAVVETARERGAATGIVTSKSRDAVELAFRVVPALRPLAEALVTAEVTEVHKPNGEPLLAALGMLGAGSEGACYVGDAPADLQAARAAGVDAIAVTWGAFSRDELAEHAPDEISRDRSPARRRPHPGTRP